MRRMVFFLVVNLLLITSLVAQSPNGSISGIVHDPSGAVIAGAEIIVVNDATGVQSSTTTNSEGIYVVPSLLPGAYRLQVSKIGFKTLIKPDIVLNVQDALALNFTLPIGAASETVTVEGGAPIVSTESAAVSTVIDRNFVQGLPLNGRSFNLLLQLTPGVVIASHATTSGEYGQFSINGQRTDANNFTVDGLSANFGVGQSEAVGESGTGGAQAFSALGSTSSLVSVDDLQEFRIETSSFAPEFGNGPGGQVIFTTRSGTNDFHGGVFDYFRNTAMDANDWFANQKGLPRAPEHHNDFGGFLGGPIRKDKSFFFLSYEGARLDQPKTTPIQVPSEYARTTAPAALVPFMDAYPQPDDRTAISGIYTAPFTGSYSNRATLNATSLRIDHTLSNRFTLFGRYNYAPSRAYGPNYSLSTFQTEDVNTETLTLGLNMALSTKLSDSVRGNYSTQSNNSTTSLDSFGGAVPFDPGLLLGSLSSSQNSATFYGLDTTPLVIGSGGKNRSGQLDFRDDLMLSAGTHQLKFGGDFRTIFLNLDTAKYQLTYLILNTQSFLSTGSVPLLSSVFLPTQTRSQFLSLYGQDTWRATSRLSLTYGVRWELSPAPSTRGNTVLSAWTNINNPAAIALAPRGTPVWATTYGNFAPRLGLAYSLTPNEDLILRMGAGIFYDLGVGSSAQLAFKFPNSAGGFFPSVPLPVSDVTPYLPTISLQPPYAAVAGFSPDLRLPRSYQWNVALEKLIGKTQSITATYVGQSGKDLLRQEALFRPNADFSGDFLLTLNDAYSNYHALQLQYRRPLGSRLHALLNYTWSHSLDNASNDVAIGLSTTVISGASDYASSDFNVGQSFSGALTYDIPMAAKSGPLSLITKDWSVDTVIVARSGFPLNGVLLSVGPDPGGSATSRPDRVPGQPVWLPDAAAPGGKILNAAAFSIPSVPRQGSEGRNDIAGFGLTQIDLSIARKIPVADRLNLQFRADAFNLFNHPNFANPGGYVQYGAFYLQSQALLNQGLGLGGLNPLFQEGGPRSLQLSLRITF
ncbi:MAG TPA: TonB-dependent receptor [Candidatus Acidoferrales bacterium]|nr:TonB-dependent receptor [Candidatus Acidoferrales bacterium]